jgi:hypothetical protein
MLRRLVTGMSMALALISPILWTGCSGLGSPSQKGTTTTIPTAAAIPGSNWGLVVHALYNFPIQVPYGQARGWDWAGGQWPDLETCSAQSNSPDDPCFNWTKLDTALTALHQAGVNDILYTLSRTPGWAVNLTTDPTGLAGTACNYYQGQAWYKAAGQCLMPTDLNADGSGTDQMWKNWVAAIAARVNDATYLQTHAHIKYWEPWNEFDRSTTLLNNPGQPGEESFEGTYAQLVRLTEDLRCIVTGKGAIHNYPLAGKSTPCTAIAIDSNAAIVSPSSGAAGVNLDVMQNFLYCNGTGAHAPLAGSQCNGANAGSQAVDIINYHLYANIVIPETVANSFVPNGRAILQAAEQNKPLISGEGSWGALTAPKVLWRDPYSRAGLVPRVFALYWSAGVAMNFWYGYDNIGNSGIVDGSTNQLNQPQAGAWIQTYHWLVGATPTNSPFCTSRGTVYTCDLTEANGLKAELVWDSQYGQNCSVMGQPIICGATQYQVPSQFNKDWIDLTGTTHPATVTVTIGANPILLESQ